MSNNVYEAAARARKVDTIITAIWEALGLATIEDACRIDLADLAAVPADLRVEFRGLIAGTRAPSDETWAQVIATVALRQRWATENLASETDAFAGF